MNKSTKENVLDILKANSGRYISGQELADQLYVTRAAIWKAIHNLKKDGYSIDGINNKGYRLNITYAPLSRSSIISSLGNEFSNLIIDVYDEVTSTNDIARDSALSGNRKECVILADHQTKGRGRNSHEFYSPQNTGIYMSFLIFPDMDPSQAHNITCMTAVAVKKALSLFSKEKISIKWVNDLFINNKKIAGILTEAGISLETYRLSYVVAGIGINLFPPEEGFPKDLTDIAGCVFPEGSPDITLKNRICAEIIKNIMHYYRTPNPQLWLPEYKASSMLLDHYIRIKDSTDKEKTYARVLGIDDNCRLLIQYDDGSTDALTAGEVSVVKY